MDYLVTWIAMMVLRVFPKNRWALQTVMPAIEEVWPLLGPYSLPPDINPDSLSVEVWVKVTGPNDPVQFFYVIWQDRENNEPCPENIFREISHRKESGIIPFCLTDAKKTRISTFWEIPKEVKFREEKFKSC